MKKYIFVILIFIILGAALSCGKPMVCPAYQSSFILDDSVRYATFSTFNADSLPKNFEADKSQFGIVVSSGYAYRNIPKETVFHPPRPIDSLFIKPPGEDTPEDSLTDQQARK